MTMEQATIDKLREARGLVSQGWCQHIKRSGDKYCIVGAIYNGTDLSSNLSSHCAAQVWLEDVLLPVTGRRSVVGWNDAPDRTQADVVDLFDRAIMLAEAQLATEQAAEQAAAELAGVS